MPTSVESWRTKRTQWTKARDDAHVKKGAVASVSLGDSLDKVYKAGAKGYRPLLAAITACEKDVKTYQTKGGKSVAAVSGALKDLTGELGGLKRGVQADITTLTGLGEFLVNFHQLAVPGIDAGLVQNTLKVMQQDKTGNTTWSDAAPRVIYKDLPKVLKFWADGIKHLHAVKFDVTLPGKDPYYKWINSLDDRYMAGYKVLAAFPKTTSLQEHNEHARAGDGTMNGLQGDLKKTDAAIKALLA